VDFERECKSNQLLLTTRNHLLLEIAKKYLLLGKKNQLIVLARIITMNYSQLKITKIIAND